MTRARLPARRDLAGLLFVLLAAAPSCSLLGGGTYQLTAFFPRAMALYPESRVKVMGVDVGEVSDIAIEGERIRVELTIDDEVPLPEDVVAAIMPITLVGERNIVLSPAWQEGEERIADGAEIPEERTVVPVEPDEALQALTDLARAIDPDAVSRLVTAWANALEGQGQAVNDLLDQAGSLTSTLAEQDERIIEAAANLHAVASTLNGREQQLGAVLSSLSDAAGVLASERDGIAALLNSVVRLTDEGTRLLGLFGGTLPGDVAILAQAAMVAEQNIGSVEELVAAFPTITEELIAAWDRERHQLVIRLNLGPSARGAFEPIFDLLGVPVPCLPLDDTACPGEGG
ncbi:MAG: MCE family protein [Acidimicrobiales bacterium]